MTLFTTSCKTRPRRRYSQCHLKQEPSTTTTFHALATKPRLRRSRATVAGQGVNHGGYDFEPNSRQFQEIQPATFIEVWRIRTSDAVRTVEIPNDCRQFRPLEPGGFANCAFECREPPT